MVAKAANSFKFKVERGVPVPTGRGGRVSSHPFPWDELKPGDSFVVPRSYWVERGDKPQNYDPNKVRERIRANFRVWAGKDKARSRNVLAMHTAPNGDIQVGFRKA